MSDGRPEPIVIGGMPGSGTRVLARIMQLSGRYIGVDLTSALDARPFRPFADRWVDTYVGSWLAGRPTADSDGMVDDLEQFVRQQKAAMDQPALPWGWKAPRSVCFLPFLYERLPGMRFVHVLRDGRDIAVKHRRKLRSLAELPPDAFSIGQSVLLERSEFFGPVPVARMAIWARLNALAADYAETRAETYHRVRLEDLCESPHDVTRDVLRFMLAAEPSSELVAAAAAVVEQPPTLGRWQRTDPAELAQITDAGVAALRRFGYLPDEA